MPNINVHEFLDKSPDLNDIVPTQSAVNGPRKYTWAALKNSILNIFHRSVSTPSTTNEIWIQADGRAFYYNGTAWVTFVGDQSPESHDFVAYVSPTGDNGMYMKGNSHYPALTIDHVVSAASNTNTDIITLFAGVHELATAASLFRADRNTVTLELMPGAMLRNNTGSNLDMIVSGYSGYTLAIKGRGAVDFDGVTYFIKDTSATKFVNLMLDFDTLNCTGTSANWDKALIETHCVNVWMNIKKVMISRTTPIFLFKGISGTHRLDCKIDLMLITATSFTAYHPGVFQFEPSGLVTSALAANIDLGQVRITGSKNICLFRLAQFHLEKASINFKVANVFSSATPGSVNADFNTTYTVPALIYLDKSNLPTLAHVNSVINITIDSVTTGGSLVYINDLNMNWCTVNIYIKAAICTHATPIVINNLSGAFCAVNIYADIQHVGDANSPIVIVKNDFSTSTSVKVKISGNLRNAGSTKGCIQVCTGSRVELHDLFLGCAASVAPLIAQTAGTEVVIKNVATNSTQTLTNVVQVGETVLQNTEFYK